MEVITYLCTTKLKETSYKPFKNSDYEKRSNQTYNCSR